MLSERIGALFELLGCGNTDIARAAGCTPSNISRLKSGARVPKAGSRTIRRLAEAVCLRAEAEELTDSLRSLCGAVSPEAVAAWLYGEGPVQLPEAAVPRSKRLQEARRRRFGERLDRAMRLLALSNVRLAAQLNVDVSLVSRYRSGIWYPTRNERLRARLSELLLARAAQKGLLPELAALCGAGADTLTPQLVTEWLHEG